MTFQQKVINVLQSRGLNISDNADVDEIVRVVAGLKFKPAASPAADSAAPAPAQPAFQIPEAYADPGTQPTTLQTVSKVTTADVSAMTPSRAGALFAEAVRKIMAEQDLTLTAAWSKTKLLYPELTARMCDNGAAALANDDPQLPAVPLASKAFLLPLFYLPQNTSDDLFTAAFRANRSQTLRVNSKDIWTGVAVYLMKTQGLSADNAHRQMRDDYPQLARAAGQM